MHLRNHVHFVFITFQNYFHNRKISGSASGILLIKFSHLQ